MRLPVPNEELLEKLTSPVELNNGFPLRLSAYPINRSGLDLRKDRAQLLKAAGFDYEMPFYKCAVEGIEQ